ncbi:uncharacterized protein J7T54_005345 [Emericellopsis cladophorae]|uniref:Xylanolytic transcriptional activator regulatory domain-containing protein n=1 Tax=Emericellopsis cladophorae TaxID=2686198 RepID=A0A9P9XW40_9HYPO|nr:uncharacterized protein J7T54_005345 [Emericellopsis cladophorae]KAI6778439.1 hypothetical protein J7T54_005345 [Emericellopsis cladophorae]
MASERKVKFVEVDTTRGGLPVKRKQVQQACAICRRKKRRCVHAQDSLEDHPGDSVNAHGQPTAQSQTSPGQGSTKSFNGRASSAPFSESGASRRTASYGEADRPNTDGIRQATFGADNSARPSETPRLEVRPPSASPAGESKLRTSSMFVGDLNPEGMFREATGSASIHETSQKGDVGIWLSSNTAGNNNGQPSQFITSRPPPVMDRFLMPFVKEHCLTCLPSELDFGKLRNIFIQKIHPIFPVLPLASLDGDIADPITIVLRQAVALATSMDQDAAPYLRLMNNGPDLMTPQDFSQAVSSSMRAILETSIIADRVLHIRAYAILSLYTQPTCSEESDLPAQLGGRAVQHIQTLGLHLLRYDAPNTNDLENLFCAVWALDKINAAMYGRPALFNERDIGANLEECIKKRSPCFRLFLLVCQWLEQVFDLYRPGPSEENSGLEKIAYIDLPVLEAMIVEADALKVPSSLIATIETFYHAVIILSCRLARPGTLPAASTLPPPSANARRSLAAERIACAVPRDCLSPVPFVPYALSLALSVEYRKMRHSRLPMFRARAMTAFRRNCAMLRNFSPYFWSAKVVAELGERVLKEMERAATNINRDATPLPLDPSEPTRNGNTDERGRQTKGGTGDMAFMNVAAGLDNMVDFAAVDAISGQDVFGHIDPNFNLTAVEDALEANLDIGMPLNWGDWVFNG